MLATVSAHSMVAQPAGWRRAWQRRGVYPDRPDTLDAASATLGISAPWRAPRWVWAAAWRGGKRVLPFAGTAHPERFFAALRAAGCEVAEPCALPDHAPLPPALLARLRAAAERAGAVLATTEKDAARLPAAERDGVAVLPLELRWADDADDALEALLGPLVRRAQESEEAVSTA